MTLKIFDFARGTYARERSESLADLSDISAEKQINISPQHADVAELADALDLGSSVPDVQVQVLSSAPNSGNPNLVPVGSGFGFLLCLTQQGSPKSSNL